MSASELTRFRSAVLKSLTKNGTIPFEQPSGTLLRAFRESILISGEPCTAKRFAEPIGVNAQNINDYENEKRRKGYANGVRMPASSFVLALITWDREIRALWQRTLPKRDK